MEQIVTLIISDERICAICQQQGYYREVALLAGPQYRRSLSVSTSGVDVRAGLNEEVAKGVMAIYRCPLCPHQPAGPMTSSPGWLTCNAVMPCSSVDRAVYRPLSNSLCIDLNSPSLANCIRSCSTGSRGGLASRSLSSTLPRPSSFPGELPALLLSWRLSGAADASRLAIVTNVGTPTILRAS